MRKICCIGFYHNTDADRQTDTHTHIAWDPLASSRSLSPSILASSLLFLHFRLGNPTLNPAVRQHDIVRRALHLVPTPYHHATGTALAPTTVPNVPTIAARGR